MNNQPNSETSRRMDATISSQAVIDYIGAERIETADYIICQLQKKRVDISEKNKEKVLEMSNKMFKDLMRRW